MMRDVSTVATCTGGVREKGARQHASSLSRFQNSTMKKNPQKIAKKIESSL
jgi:hypothetical protein